MITDNDIEKIKNKLEKYFITKDEFKKEMKMINQRFDGVDKKFDNIDKRFDEVMDGIKMIIGITHEHDERFDQLEEKMDKNFDELHSVDDDHARAISRLNDKVFSTT